MLLQKTGWRTKQWLPHRRSGNDSLEDTVDIVESHRIDNTSSTHFSRRLSWLSQNSPATLAQRRASSSSSTEYPALPQPTSTAHSSASSLSSCDCDANTASIDSLSRPELAPAASEVLCPPKLCSTTTCSDAGTWRLVLSETPLSRSPNLCSVSIDTKESVGTTLSTQATLDILEALSIDPLRNGRTRTQNIQNTDDSNMDISSDKVELLVRGTGQALQARDISPADRKAAIQDGFDRNITAPIYHTPSIPHDVLRKQPSLPIPKPVSASKGKRRIFSRGKIHSLGREVSGAILHPSSGVLARWTDPTTNMADISSGKFFKSEVDEMLTSGRMQQLRKVATFENGPKTLMRSTHSTEIDGTTRTDPFPSRGSPFCIRAQAHQPPFPSPILLPPAIPPLDIPGKRYRDGNATFSNVPASDTRMVFRDLGFPAPKNRQNHRPPSRGAPFLPTIPEISPLVLSLPQSSSPQSALADTDPGLSLPTEPGLAPSCIALSSTPFTLTSPLFRHGPIRLEQRKKKSSLEKEALDWTAFQIAILGTTDEDHEGSDEAQLDEAELDDITLWFSDFGFGVGRLVKEKPKRKRIKVYLKDGNAQKRTWRGRLGKDIVIKDDLEEVPIGGVKTDDESVESLPLSPMLDLTPSCLHKEVIPMGYNLGHDIGDFLKWEVQHVQQSLFLESD